MPQKQTRANDARDGQIPIVRAEATVSVQGECPDRPEQCTCMVDGITANARVTGSLTAAADIACQLTVTLTTEGNPGGDVTVSVTPVNGVSFSLTSQTVSAPTSTAPEVVVFPFTLLGTSGQLVVKIKHGTNESTMHTMDIS